MTNIFHAINFATSLVIDPKPFEAQLCVLPVSKYVLIGTRDPSHYFEAEYDNSFIESPTLTAIAGEIYRAADPSVAEKG